MAKTLPLSQASEFLGDCADCMRESIEIMVVLDKQLSSEYSIRIKKLILEANRMKKEMEGIKGEIHRNAYEPVPDIFSQCISVRQADISRLIQAIGPGA